MRSMSVSELLTWRHCQRQHSFAYGDRIEPKIKNEFMASGSAVHKAIEKTLLVLRDSPRRYEAEEILSLCEQYGREELEVQFEFDERPEEKVERYIKGVEHALSVAPAELWDTTAAEYHIEEPLSLQLTPTLAVHGRPDLYRVTDEKVELLEFKTTESPALKYLLWNPQHRIYAMILSTMYPEKVVTFQYYCVPTRGKMPKLDIPWVATNKRNDATWKYLIQLLSEMEATQNLGFSSPNFTRSCDFCQFNPLCATIETGGDLEQAKQEGFRPSVRRG